MIHQTHQMSAWSQMMTLFTAAPTTAPTTTLMMLLLEMPLKLLKITSTLTSLRFTSLLEYFFGALWQQLLLLLFLLILSPGLVRRREMKARRNLLEYNFLWQ